MSPVTVGVLTKGNIGRTTLSRVPHSARHQIRTTTTHFVPLLQALVHEETHRNYVRLFNDVADLVDSVAPNPVPFQQRVSQVHKDYRNGIESARAEVFPDARPCDDYPHFLRNANVKVPAKCQHVRPRQDGKGFEKRYANRTMWYVRLTHTPPTLPLFSCVWRAIFATMDTVWKEPMVEEYFAREYFKEVSPSEEERMARSLQHSFVRAA